MNQAQHEPGIRALVAIATIERDRALANWRRSSGDDMVRCQTRYNAMQELIDIVLKRPAAFDRPTNRRGE